MSKSPDDKDSKDEIKDEMAKLKQKQDTHKEGSKDKDSKEAVKPDKVAELTDDLKRVQAEFENYKKRCEKENSNYKEFALSQLVKKLLMVLDSFEMAFRNSDDPDRFKEGVELIYSQFYNILKEEGLQPIEVKEGDRFDPYFHEVMLSAKSDKEDETIIEELQKGYKFKGGIIRHSKVKVVKN